MNERLQEQLQTCPKVLLKIDEHDDYILVIREWIQETEILFDLINSGLDENINTQLMEKLYLQCIKMHQIKRLLQSQDQDITLFIYQNIYNQTYLNLSPSLFLDVKIAKALLYALEDNFILFEDYKFQIDILNIFVIYASFILGLDIQSKRAILENIKKEQFEKDISQKNEERVIRKWVYAFSAYGYFLNNEKEQGNLLMDWFKQLNPNCPKYLIKKLYSFDQTITMKAIFQLAARSLDDYKDFLKQKATFENNNQFKILDDLKKKTVVNTFEKIINMKLKHFQWSNSGQQGDVMEKQQFYHKIIQYLNLKEQVSQLDIFNHYYFSELLEVNQRYNYQWVGLVLFQEIRQGGQLVELYYQTLDEAQKKQYCLNILNSLDEEKVSAGTVTRILLMAKSLKKIQQYYLSFIFFSLVRKYYMQNKIGYYYIPYVYYQLGKIELNLSNLNYASDFLSKAVKFQGVSTSIYSSNCDHVKLHLKIFINLLLVLLYSQDVEAYIHHLKSFFDLYNAANPKTKYQYRFEHYFFKQFQIHNFKIEKRTLQKVYIQVINQVVNKSISTLCDEKMVNLTDAFEISQEVLQDQIVQSIKPTSIPNMMLKMIDTVKNKLKNKGKSQSSRHLISSNSFQNISISDCIQSQKKNKFMVIYLSLLLWLKNTQHFFDSYHLLADQLRKFFKRIPAQIQRTVYLHYGNLDSQMTSIQEKLAQALLYYNLNEYTKSYRLFSELRKDVIKKGEKETLCYNEMIVLKYLGKLELYLGNDGSAVKYLEQLKRNNYQDAEVHFLLGLVYKERQEWAKCANELRKCAHSDKQVYKAPCYFFLMQMKRLERMGESEGQWEGVEVGHNQFQFNISLSKVDEIVQSFKWESIENGELQRKKSKSKVSLELVESSYLKKESNEQEVAQLQSSQNCFSQYVTLNSAKKASIASFKQTNKISYIQQQCQVEGGRQDIYRLMCIVQVMKNRFSQDQFMEELLELGKDFPVESDVVLKQTRLKCQLHASQNSTIDLVEFQGRSYARKTLECEVLENDLQLKDLKNCINEIVISMKVRRIAHQHLVAVEHFALSFTVLKDRIEVKFFLLFPSLNRIDQAQFSYNEKLEFSLQILHGIEALHQHGIYHLDIKPDNVMVTDHKLAKIIDFGSAIRKDRIHDYSLCSYTLLYSPKEVFNGDPDAKSDLYGLGLIMFELFSHHKVWSSIHNSSLNMGYFYQSQDFHKTHEDHFKKIKDPNLRDIILGCTRIRVHDRYNTAQVYHLLSNIKKKK